MKRIYIYLFLLMCNPLYLSAFTLKTDLDNVWYATVKDKRPSSMQSLPKNTNVNLDPVDGILFDYKRTGKPHYYLPLSGFSQDDLRDQENWKRQITIDIHGTSNNPLASIGGLLGSDGTSFRRRYSLSHATKKILLAENQDFLPISSILETKQEAAAAAGAGAGAGPGAERKTAAAGAGQNTEQLMARIAELEQRVRNLETENRTLREENNELRKVAETESAAAALV